MGPTSAKGGAEGGLRTAGFIACSARIEPQADAMASCQGALLQFAWSERAEMDARPKRGMPEGQRFNPIGAAYGTRPRALSELCALGRAAGMKRRRYPPPWAWL